MVSDYCFFLPAPLPEVSILFPFLLDAIDLVDLVWFLGKVRFWKGFEDFQETHNNFTRSNPLLELFHIKFT